MVTDTKTEIKVINTTATDLNAVLALFREAMALQGKEGYRVWEDIDTAALQKDIEQGLQYKMVRGADILCIFSIQRSDPFIWREKDRGDAVYLHRIVVNAAFKGQRLFQKVLDWASRFSQDNGLRYLRMDTWAENKRIIDYYQSFGFVFIETYRTPDVPGLPLQNRNLEVALLQLDLVPGNEEVP